MTWPKPIRQFLTDFIETALGMVLALQFVMPTTVDEGMRVAALVLGAIASAFVSAFRRAAPSLVAWMKAKLGTEGTD